VTTNKNTTTTTKTPTATNKTTTDVCSDAKTLLACASGKDCPTQCVEKICSAKKVIEVCTAGSEDCPIVCKNTPTNLNKQISTSTPTNSTVKISSSSLSVSPNQWIDVTVKVDTSYNGNIDFCLVYKAEAFNPWDHDLMNRIRLSDYYTTSSSFTNGYTFKTSDKGTKTFNSFLQLKKAGYYQLAVMDEWGQCGFSTHADSIDFVVGDIASPNTYSRFQFNH
jgi:hypothetical protein